jgi:hypothetical protein
MVEKYLSTRALNSRSSLELSAMGVPESDDDIVVLDSDWNRLCAIRPRNEVTDRDGIPTHAGALGIAVRLSRRDVELPVMPWTLQHMVRFVESDISGSRALDQRRYEAEAELCALMRTSVEQCVKRSRRR